MAILFLLLFGPEKLPTVIVEGMRMFRQLRSAAEEATGEIRREFEAAASEIEAAKKELTSAVDEVQRFGAETRALVDEAQREAVGGKATDGGTSTSGTDMPDDVGSILPPDMAEMLHVHDVDPAEHAIQAMGGGGADADGERDAAAHEAAEEVEA
ncbi:MAG: hypothetical protein IT332_04210 [Ardenticatenales bacterium]|nr:hypothetical protein [Ardenticatenales bacterium]